MFLIVFMYAAWSTCFSIGKELLQFTTPLFLTGIRMLFGALIMLGYLLFRKRSALRIKTVEIFPLLCLALFSVYLTNVLEFWALQHMTAGKTCFIYSFCPFFSAILSYIHFKEKMTSKKWIGLGIGMAGMFPVIMMETGNEGLIGGLSIFSWPSLAIMGAAFCSVYGWVLLRILVKNNSLTPFAANGYSMLIGGTFALIHSLFIDSWTPTPIEAGFIPSFLKGTLLMTFISNVVCYNLYGYLLKRYTATLLSFMGLLSPFFASIFGLIILKEPISWMIFVSTSIVILGLWLVYKEEIKQGYIEKIRKEPVKKAG